MMTSDGQAEIIRVGQLLKEGQHRLVLAESMTAGALAATIAKDTDAGSFFLGSYVCYDDVFKEHAMGVSPELLKKYGGVSIEVTNALVLRLEHLLPEASVYLAVTGFAFDCPATSKEKPVGTVFIRGRLYPKERTASGVGRHFGGEFRFTGSAESIVSQSMAQMLGLLLEQLESRR